MRILVALGLFFIIIWTNSFIGTTDIANWFIENALTLIALLLIFFTFKTYRFSNGSYFLICIFLCLHVYGSKDTYANNLFGFWLQDIFETSRNQYDRLVHFSFGLLLFYPLQEFFSKHLKSNKCEAYTLPILIVLSTSAIYEIIEWLVADVFFTPQGMAYLGTQGDIWDSQKDMAVAFAGVILAALIYFVIDYLNHKSKKDNMT
jgi:putative membrane protein